MLLAMLCFIVVIIRIIIYRSSQKQMQFVVANTNYIICVYIYKVNSSNMDLSNSTCKQIW